MAVLSPQKAVEVSLPDPYRTARLALRPLRAGDRDSFLAALSASREALSRWIGLWEGGKTDTDVFDRQLELASRSQERRSVRLVGILEDGRVAGCFNLSDITHGLESKAEVSWWVRSDLTGQGLGREGASWLVHHALSTTPKGLGLSRVFATVHEQNHAGKRTALAVGLTPADRMTATVRLGGQWIPHVVYTRSATL